MSRVETYSVSVDFPNGISAGDLRNEITDNVSITTPLRSIVIEGDDCNIEFAYPIQASERTALDVVVAAHVRDPTTDGVPVTGGGTLYKKNGSNAVYWKSDGGVEINLTVPNADTTSAAASDLVTSSSSDFFLVNGMSVTAPTDGKYEIRLSTSVETSTNSIIAEIVFYKNGAIISGPYVSCGGSAAIYPTCLSSVQTLAANDLITVHARKASGNGNYKLYYRQLTLVHLG